MGIFHAVILSRQDGTPIARVNPMDYRYPYRGEGWTRFQREAFPTVLAAAEDHFGHSLLVRWIDSDSTEDEDLWDREDLPALLPETDTRYAVEANAYRDVIRLPITEWFLKLGPAVQ